MTGHTAKHAPDHGGGPPRHSLSTDDPGEAARALRAAFGLSLRMTAGPARLGGPFELDWTDLGSVRLCVTRQPGTLENVGTSQLLVVTEVLDGHFEGRGPDGGTRFASGQVVAGCPGTRFAVRTVDLHARSAVLSPALLYKTAGPTRARGPVRFTSPVPASDALARHWRATTTYLTDLFDSPAPLPEPITTGAAQLLAETVLAVFPNTLTPPEDPGVAQPMPDGVGRAVTFIDDHAHLAITVSDIAKAAGLPQGTLRYVFRRHLGTTIESYLRDVRLHHAHHDLLDTDPAAATVAQIASRWGFGSPSYFSTLYREHYECLPSTSLHT